MTVARLPPARYIDVVRDTPLVSIDLLVQDDADRLLLGWRNNRPAQHHWFVPGGALYKNETLDAAFARIALTELGLDSRRADADYLGVFEHFYPDNFLDRPNITTHYVVHAYRLRWPAAAALQPDQQHGDWRWFHLRLDSHQDVHPYTLAYIPALLQA